jgi:hypothetical protein
MSTCTKTTYSWTHGREAIDSGAPAASQTAITLRNWLRFTPFELVGVHTAFFFFVSLSILFSFSYTNSPVLEHQGNHPTVGRHPTPVSSSQEYLPLRSSNPAPHCRTHDQSKMASAMLESNVPGEGVYEKIMSQDKKRVVRLQWCRGLLFAAWEA